MFEVREETGNEGVQGLTEWGEGFETGERVGEVDALGAGELLKTADVVALEVGGHYRGGKNGARE